VVSEAGERADLVAAQREHHQAADPSDRCVRIWQVVGKGWLVVGPGRPVLAGRRGYLGLHPGVDRRPGGVTERDAGVAAGLIDTSQQLGGAIGIAVASTVAAVHSRVLLSQGHGAADALTGGFHWALWASGTVALTAVPVTFLLTRRAELAQAATAQRPEAQPAPVAD
jgi:hypothetical protein